MDSSGEKQHFLPNHRYHQYHHHHQQYNHYYEPTAHSQPHAFPANISSYFRRPAKVVKQSSRDNSPKILARRRTTASHSTTRHHAAWKGSSSIYGMSGADSNDAAVTGRPISWHPNSMASAPLNGWTASHQFPDSLDPTPYSSHPFATAQVNGLITPLTQPSSGESCYKEAFTPLEEMPAQSLDDTYSFPEQAGNQLFWPRQDNVAPHYTAHQPSLSRETYLQDGALPLSYATSHDMYTGTAPPTPDFLATPDDAVVQGDGSRTKPPSDDEVLVGMGLYDAPSPPNATALYGNQVVLPHRRSGGKGLKLEETFQPSTEDTSDDDVDDDACNEDETKASELTQQFVPAPICEKPLVSEAVARPVTTTLADQSFFFDDDADQEQPLHQAYDQHFTGSVWTDVYSGAPCNWI